MTSVHWQVPCSPVSSLMNPWVDFSAEQAIANIIGSKLHQGDVKMLGSTR